MRLSGHRTRSVFDRYNIVSEDDLIDASTKLQQFLVEAIKDEKVAPMQSSYSVQVQAQNEHSNDTLETQKVEGLPYPFSWFLAAAR
jgi:hypothetical protein